MSVWGALGASLTNLVNDIQSSTPNLNFSSPSIYNSIPTGSTSLNSQMEAIAWGAMTGLPVVGIPMAGIAYAAGAKADPIAGGIVYVGTGLALYYFAPATSRRMLAIAGYGLSRQLGFRLAGPTWRVLFSSGTTESGAYVGGRYMSASMWILFAYGVYRWADWYMEYSGENLPKAAPVGGPAPFGG